MADDDESRENNSILAALTKWEKLNFLVLMLSIIIAPLMISFFEIDNKSNIPAPFAAAAFLIILGSWIRNVTLAISGTLDSTLLKLFRIIGIIIMPLGIVLGLASDKFWKPIFGKVFKGRDP